MLKHKTGKVDQLKIEIFETRELLGKQAARLVAASIRELLLKQQEVNIIFGAAASQDEFLASLLEEDVDWEKVNAFHMDEYIGLPTGAEQHFSCFLNKRLFDHVPLKNIFYLDGSAADPNKECERYTDLLNQYKPDISCLGIGENTHLAFNDPHVADFNDPYKVKVIDLDIASKQQQVSEGCFDVVEAVPTYAYTLTIPALLEAEFIYCMVPSTRKAEAVYKTLTSEISAKHPATILRTLPNVVLLLDPDSSSRIENLLDNSSFIHV